MFAELMKRAQDEAAMLSQKFGISPEGASHFAFREPGHGLIWLKKLSPFVVSAIMVAWLLLLVPVGCWRDKPTESEGWMVLVQDMNANAVLQYRYRDRKDDNQPTEMAIIRVDGTAQFEAVIDRASLLKPRLYPIVIPTKRPSTHDVSGPVVLEAGQLWLCNDVWCGIRLTGIRAGTADFSIFVPQYGLILSGSARVESLMRTLEGFELSSFEPPLLFRGLSLRQGPDLQQGLR